MSITVKTLGDMVLWSSLQLRHLLILTTMRQVSIVLKKSQMPTFFGTIMGVENGQGVYIASSTQSRNVLNLHSLAALAQPPTRLDLLSRVA